MNNGAMETVEYMWVDIQCILDCIVGFCHKTAEIHIPCMSCSSSEYTKLDTAAADGDEACKTLNPLQCLKAQHGETRTYLL